MMKKFNQNFMDTVDSVVLALVVVMLLFTLAGRIYQVDGDSMNTTLTDGDRILVSQLFYTPKQGDIVCFVSKDMNEKILVKRIVATSGQTIDINEQNKVVIDGQVLEEDYLNTWIYTEPKHFDFPYTVQEGEVFCLGDNRINSKDSRDLGPIETRYLMGRLILRLAPNFGVVN